MAANRRCAVIVDRDGTVMLDVGYPKSPCDVRLLPGAGSALARLRANGFLLILASNQSGIGRGLVGHDEALRVHETLVSELAEVGVQFDGSYYCPHRPGEGCACRKPEAGLLLRAARELDLDLTRCFVVGDQASDVEAGRRAGCRTVLLAGDSQSGDPGLRPDFVATCWPEVVRYILGGTQEGAG